MSLFVLSCLCSLLATLSLIRSAKKHAHVSHDHDLSGPQKFHARPVPRIGGIGLFAGALGGLFGLYFIDMAASVVMLKLLLCALPTYLSGLVEDLTKNVSPSRRLFCTAISATFAYFVLHAEINRAGFDPVDQLLIASPWLAFGLTILVVTGVTNAVNIIDGFNGLAAMCVLMMMLAMAYVAHEAGDKSIFWISLAMAGAVMGFFVWNFPAGLIFMGDGGAYLLGFLIAELSVLIVHRNPSVSPVFPVLACIYPIFETLFSIYRKRFIRGMSPAMPDGVHLHMLVYKRLMRWAIGSRDAREMTRRNSMTSPYLWGLCMAAVVPAMLFWNNTLVLLFFIFLFALTYIGLYWKIVRFRAPRWMVRSRHSKF